MSLLDDALGVLLGDDLAHVVELAVCVRDGVVEAHSRGGVVGITADGRRAWVRGTDPLGRQDPGAFSPLDDEMQNRRPAASDNHYPFAYDNIAQLFADRRAPDIAVVHTPAHNWEERGGHRGEHGSADVVQSRAPFIVAGDGIRARGMLDDAARMIDVAPTVAALAGIESVDGLYLRAQQGRARTELFDGRPDRVVCFLWDGTNANVLYAMAAAGELPNVARLMDAGAAFAGGCIASFPSVTLANHTTAVTGTHPGRHGVLNNFYFDRPTGQQIVANSPETWHAARDHIASGVQTIFEVLEPLGGTAAINEPADRGAGYATFDIVRAAGGWAAMQRSVPTPSDVPGTSSAFLPIREYAWSSAADHLAVQQAEQVLASGPRLMWVNLILPDAVNHAGGPYAEIAYQGLRETDVRMGRIIDAVERAGGSTAYLLFADHGMEESEPDCKGDFDESLERAGIPFRDEGYGFIYLDP